MYILGVRLARQISVSNEVYELLLEKKGKRSFSEVIKDSICSQKEKTEIMSFAGALKKEKKTLEDLKAKIEQEREANYGRSLK
jgi:predicted CopG family antitoxin